MDKRELAMRRLELAESPPPSLKIFSSTPPSTQAQFDPLGEHQLEDSACSLDTVLRLRAARATTEKRLVRKQDAVILPMTLLLYLASHLDRSNLGSARLQGLEVQVLNNSDTAYSIALSCFFVTYIILSIPGTLLGKAIDAATCISIGAFVWSIATTCQAAARTPGGLYTARCFVGVGEAMFGQVMAFHLSLWYTKPELSKRVSLVLSGGALAGGFSGLIAYGIGRLGQTAIQPWRILFLMEGLPSVLLAIVAFFCYPSRPSKSQFLTEAERALSRARMNDQSTYEATRGIKWNAVRRALFDWKTYTFAIMYSCMNLTLGSVAGFLPTIIRDLGYTATDAQLWTIPPYLVALGTTFALSSVSDRTQSRGVATAGVFLIGIAGWSVLLGTRAINASNSQFELRYVGCILVVTAAYGTIPLIIAWVTANTGSESQRGIGLGMLNTVGHCLSIVAAFAFPSRQGPDYREGITLNLAFQGLGFTIAVCLTVFFRMENRRRDTIEGTPKTGVTLNTMQKLDLAPGFRYAV
ncbi:BZ3500_MvSof-1268-A1-R1_Chr6-2g08444 [Microbotryum saponariae]|uniref:BZ3500_MvSof-1268-A1-R1_Chr6-2g08444 protein n=1 Tax=Microbotryum saponariae TaxID=289078 RepID=A0A2X0KHL9_9BASI|nr:BZ3500_MvSof-1268-A1-R1_Chr6-2g08444 [Microbotryum saponariae]SDA07721.1 BZ3501_MvSof-1269-A2-R1_Chr6-1g08158 [Microbotryum saponariae]